MPLLAKLPPTQALPPQPAARTVDDLIRAINVVDDAKISTAARAEATKALDSLLVERLATRFPDDPYFTDPSFRQAILGADNPFEVLKPYAVQIHQSPADFFLGLDLQHAYSLLHYLAHRIQIRTVFDALVHFVSLPPAPEGEPVYCKIGTSSIPLDPKLLNQFRDEVLKFAGLLHPKGSALWAKVQTLDPEARQKRIDDIGADILRGPYSQRYKFSFEKTLWKMVGTAGFLAALPEAEIALKAWLLGKPASTPAPARVIEQQEPQKHEQQLAQDRDIIIKPDGTLVKGGLPYRPLSAAATEAQVHPTTLLRWINNPKFEGPPLQTYYFAPAHTHFISEESIRKLANRFVKWPSEEPAGAVTLGETKDKSGFIGMSEAADIAGVSRRTMWLWVSQGKAPIDNIDLIKDPNSEHFYIRERDVYALKKFVPRSGLQRGRRPQLTLEP